MRYPSAAILRAAAFSVTSDQEVRPETLCPLLVVLWNIIPRMQDSRWCYRSFQSITVFTFFCFCLYPFVAWNTVLIPWIVWLQRDQSKSVIVIQWTTEYIYALFKIHLDFKYGLSASIFVAYRATIRFGKSLILQNNKFKNVSSSLGTKKVFILCQFYMQLHTYCIWGQL